MRIVTRALIAVGTVAALSFTITPVDANAASTLAPGPTAADELALAKVGTTTAAASGKCHRNYSGKKYCNGERPYHGWSRYHDDENYYDDDYYGNGDDSHDFYGDGDYDEYPLVCGPSRYSCRAPRRPLVTPVELPATLEAQSDRALSQRMGGPRPR